ncbi:lymphocyte antigen 75-like isoform X1 [Panulirus ornatus]|uniref:lymphocyte antigen 75-like isoform X1 n=2 Tax=Panulirus ornatus TaxID=150431 RepID=UPI003A8A3CF4
MALLKICWQVHEELSLRTHTFSQTVMKIVMMVTWVVLALLACAGAVSGGRERESRVACAAGFGAIAGGCYSFHQEARTWDAAMAECRDHRATLVSVVNTQQYTGLLDHLNANYPGTYWTSGRVVSGRWMWTVTGEAMPRKWWGHAPTNAPNQCAYFCSNTLKYWAKTCDASLRYICEKQPEVPQDVAPDASSEFFGDDTASSYENVYDEDDIAPPRPFTDRPRLPHVPAEVADTSGRLVSSVGAAAPLSAATTCLLITTLLLL